jgi:hypothetical protein
MENLLFFLATSFAIRRFSAPRKFKNCFIGDTGCSALLYSGDEGIDSITTRTGDDLYYHECKEKNISYGLICIKLNQTYELEAAEQLLGVYIDKLRQPFHIRHNTGLNKDEDWNQVSSATLTDYWQDSHKTDWKVKGYTDGRHMAVLFVKNIGQADVNKQDLFLDSFHFGHSY